MPLTKLFKFLKIHSENKFTHLLIILLMLFIVAPFLEGPSPRHPLISLVVILAIVFTLRVLDISKRTFNVCAVIAFSTFTLEILFMLTVREPLVHFVVSITMILIYASFLLLSLVLMIRKMFTTTRVTGDTIRGGICVYFLIGYFFTMVYYLIFVIDRQAFMTSTPINSISLPYLSFATLTTLGYGDICPVNKLAMVFTNLEAVVGQLYLVIFIARIIGLHIIHEHKHS